MSEQAQIDKDALILTLVEALKAARSYSVACYDDDYFCSEVDAALDEARKAGY